MICMNLLGIIAQAASETPEMTEVAEGGQSLFSLLWHANGVVQLTLLLLLGFSIVSWAIIGSKYRQLKKIKERSGKFYQQFWQAPSIDDVVNKGRFQKSPPFVVFKAGLDVMQEKKGDNKHLVEREIRRTAEDEIEQMEYGVPFLATTGSAAPFIGLFGTVWGILHAFWKIGRTGASSLAIVGPHIAEALIATAIGLAAAIPAVIFYNVYANRIRLLAKDLTDFSNDLLTRLDEEYFAKR